MVQQDFREMRKDIEDVLHILGDLVVHMDKRFDSVAADSTVLRPDIYSVLTSLDTIAGRQEIDDQERLVIGFQLNRLDGWVHQLAHKIGVQLS